MKTSNENEEEMEEREWVINGFKTFSAVAQEYFPEYSNADTASKKNEKRNRTRQTALRN